MSSMLNDSLDNFQIENRIFLEDDEEQNDEFYDTETEPSVLIDCSLNISVDNSMINQSIQDTEQIYYAVQFIDRSKIDREELSKQIFMKRENALKLCKKYAANARFKVFRCFQEAYSFSYEIDGNSQKEPQKSGTDSSESLPFPRPATKELNEFRMFIEKNDLVSVKKKLINPRYLISSGDSPVIIKESCRYNTLHICAINNHFDICEYILNILSNVDFIRSLYTNDTCEQAEMRIERIMDLYLNMPEKGFHETPLHFACKYGSYEVVKLFLNRELCTKTVLNKQNQIPFDMICLKYMKGDVEKNKIKIKSLFEDCFYVPFFRDNYNFESFVSKPVRDDKITDMKGSPNDNLRTKILTAFVGPTSPSKAKEIYERLKSPTSLKSSPNHLDVMRSDDYKGYERVGRELSEKYDVKWVEYWDFLGCFCNLKTNEGLIKLEYYLRQKLFENILNSQIKACETIKKMFNL